MENEIESDYETKPASAAPPPSQKTGAEETNVPINDTFEAVR